MSRVYSWYDKKGQGVHETKSLGTSGLEEHSEKTIRKRKSGQA